MLLLAVNALFVAAAIFANLAVEETGLDLPVIAVLVVFVAGIWRRLGLRPLVLYYGSGYGAGLAASVAFKVVS
jgi:hypothetical protein